MDFFAWHGENGSFDEGKIYGMDWMRLEGVHAPDRRIKGV